MNANFDANPNANPNANPENLMDNSFENSIGDSGSPDTPKDQANQKALMSCGIVAIGLLLILGLLAVFVINPMMQSDIDPDATGPNISASKSENRKDSDPDHPKLRGSFTDLLVQPRDVTPEHPLDPALEVARLGLEKIRKDVRDYSALMVKQERINGKLLPEEFMQVKVRHGHSGSDEGNVNKAFYIRHVKPKAMAGQEAIWIENENDGKLIAHGTGMAKLIPVPPLPPTGMIAMRNNRYPITELGIETLILRMIEKGDRDRKHQDGCEVTVDRDLEFDGNPCTRITITHPDQKAPFEFHIAKIYIDDTLQLPVGYEGFMWPAEPGGEPVLVERYFYRELKVNIGLTDQDFDPQNPEYDY